MRRYALTILLILSGDVLVAEDDADSIVDMTDVQGGLIVHLYCGDGQRTAALHANDRFVVHSLDADVTTARKHIQSLGLYGNVSVSPWMGERLPYVDNLVNLVVADDLGKLPMHEVMRVLAPEGVALIGEKKIVKPRPNAIDEWPQHHHGPDNNAVACDRVVGPPRHYQWINDPVWSRSHLGMASITSLISAKSRLFSIEDRASVENPALPGKFFLICRDTFNGIELWRHRMPDWHPTNIFIKLTPSQLQRQLVAIDDRVYCTPGLNAPITVFDAMTGEILRIFDGTEMTQEFVYSTMDSVVCLDRASGRQQWRTALKTSTQVAGSGLLYLGPPACSCANKVQLNMLNALAPEPSLKSSGQPLNIAIRPQLEKGPAYAAVIESTSPVTSADWPTYRRDSSRSGHTEAPAIARLQPRWQTQLTTRASAPVIVAGQVFVADVDAHTVCALNADNGDVQWTFTAGGRVDSPPSWHKGRLLFGGGRHAGSVPQKRLGKVI